MDGARGYLLDTGVMLHATRENSPVAKAIDAQFGLRASRFRPAIREVTVGELLAFSLSNKWGEKRRELLRAKITRRSSFRSRIPACINNGQTSVPRSGLKE